MDWKLFFATFGLIFLAELGDKTQLASMAASAGTKSPLSVFLGASLALVFSTLVAILFGSTLQRFVPQHVLRGGAAILFFLFGTILLVSAFRVKAQAAAEIPAGKGVVAPSRGLSRIVIDAAIEFERSTVEDYESLAEKADAAELGDLFRHLADEEKEHIAHLRQLTVEHKEQAAPEAHVTQPFPPKPKIPHEGNIEAAVDKAIQHEKATAGFYSELARFARLSSVQKTLEQLAREEMSHVAHLEELKSEGRATIG